MSLHANIDRSPMAATPEPPFSPSAFLDLPPTPPPQSDDGGDILPYVSRMLMEDDDFLYQLYPADHPALLAALQSYAQIISDTAASATSSDSDNASPSFVSAAAHIGATGTKSSPFLDRNDEEANTTITSLLTGDGLPSASILFDGSAVDMLSSAFLRGVEEATKFLPRGSSSLLVDGDSKEDDHELRATATAGNGRRRRKNDDGDDMEMESETGRRSKVMVPLPWKEEEPAAREIMDEIMLRQCEMCVKGMQELRVAMSREAEISCRKPVWGRRIPTATTTVDLHTMLVSCAQSVTTGDRRGAAAKLDQIRRHSSPWGDATQRLAGCLADALEARLAGAGSEVYRSLMARRIPAVDFLGHHRLFMSATPVKVVKFTFANRTIVDAVAGRRCLHIVDYGVQYGFQWPELLKQLVAREGGPPEVRITGIDFPRPGFRPDSQVKETRRRLSDCARRFGVPFKFHGIVARWETVGAEDLDLDPGEVLVVNSQSDLGKVADGSVVATDGDEASPRDAVLGNIRRMRPDVFVQWVVNGRYGAPFFLTRFREALAYYSVYFDLLDATIPRDNGVRTVIERDLLGRAALNVIACEGADRVDWPETYRQWAVRNHRAGLRQLPLKPEVVELVREKARNGFHKDFVVDEDGRWLLQGWKGRVLFATAAWVAADD